MPAERREQVIVVGIGSTGNGRNPMINGGRQPSYGGTSRMNREVHVRICERLGVQLPGATRRQARCTASCGAMLDPRLPGRSERPLRALLGAIVALGAVWYVRGPGPMAFTGGKSVALTDYRDGDPTASRHRAASIAKTMPIGLGERRWSAL